MISFKGFTLIELLVAIGILALTLSLGTVGWNRILKQSYADTVAGQLANDFREGRLAAINENEFVTLCPTENRIHCNNDWSLPLMLFTDANKNKKLDIGETLIRDLGNRLGKFDLRIRPANRYYFRWAPLGISHGSPGSITICDQQFVSANRKITVSMLGRTRMSRDMDDDGIHEDKHGNDLNCI